MLCSDAVEHLSKALVMALSHLSEAVNQSDWMGYLFINYIQHPSEHSDCSASGHMLRPSAEPGLDRL